MNKIIPKYSATVDELGKLHIKDIVKFKQYLMRLKGEVEIVVKKKSNRKSRSNQQNKYYWGIVLIIIADYMGDTIESAHDALRMLFLKDMTKSIPRIKSTTDLTTIDFETYMSEIRIYMSREHSVYIPTPNEVDYE